MDSGVLLNNHDELSAALRNIRRTDSDGEEVEDDDDEEDEEEESDEDNDGEILNPQVKEISFFVDRKDFRSQAAVCYFYIEDIFLKFIS